MGVRVTRRDGTVETYGHAGDGEWTATRDDRTRALSIAFLRARMWPELRRVYRSEEWVRVEIR